MNAAIYIEKDMLFNLKKQLQRAVKLLHLKIARCALLLNQQKNHGDLFAGVYNKDIDLG